MSVGILSACSGYCVVRSVYIYFGSIVTFPSSETVDLNPIRANMAKTPETSDHTSIQRRIQSVKSEGRKQQSLVEALFPFAGNPRETMPEGLPFRMNDYLDLVGSSYASCVRGINASMHVTGPAALFVTISAAQFGRPFRQFWND